MNLIPAKKMYGVFSPVRALRPVKAHPDAIKARDTNKCKVKKALAILAQSQTK